MPDRLALEKWAGENRISGDYDTILAHDATQKLYTQQLERYSQDFKKYEQPRKFKLIAEEFSVDNGMLTPKMSLKRNVVQDRYAAEISELQGGLSHSDVARALSGHRVRRSLSPSRVLTPNKTILLGLPLQLAA